MNIEGLLKKSEDNIQTGNFAEKNKYYDVAISRFYYAILQKIIYISKHKGFYSNPKTGEDSHIQVIKNFNKNMNDKLDAEDITKLSSLLRLKKLRVDADYEVIRLNDKNVYNLKFKYYYNDIINVLNRFA